MWFSDEPTVELTVCGQPLSIIQDNSTMHVGTTVWESSLVFSKWLEKNRKIGEFSEDKLRGKRAIELGAGCGIAGMAMALLGCNITMTDIPAVLPILKKNVKRNYDSLNGKAGKHSGPEPGKIKTAQLLWGQDKQIEAVKPPYDFVVAADVVYLEDIVHPLISTMQALAGYDTRIFLGYKLRQEEAHELFWAELPKVFDVQHVAREELHSDYAFDGVDLYILHLKREGGLDEHSRLNAANNVSTGVSTATPSALPVEGQKAFTGQRLGSREVREIANDKNNMPNSRREASAGKAAEDGADNAGFGSDVEHAQVDVDGEATASLASSKEGVLDREHCGVSGSGGKPRAESATGQASSTGEISENILRPKTGIIRPEFRETITVPPGSGHVINQELRPPVTEANAQPSAIRQLQLGGIDPSKLKGLTKKGGLR